MLQMGRVDFPNALFAKCMTLKSPSREKIRHSQALSDRDLPPPAPRPPTHALWAALGSSPKLRAEIYRKTHTNESPMPPSLTASSLPRGPLGSANRVLR
ncbi:hypothetical protein RRG08_014874 [Elysia crispata]|uniref:Uncharacterized protein n=1 Tax=Elysia crispata TaxID=231223 RepID=A0AAE1AMP9_9GAST|nr:hypothetical protein RRG08_014874 [Elysia crispata]